MSIYVIDYENVNGAGLKGIEKLLDTDIVVLFYSINRHQIDIDDVKKINASKATFIFKEVNVRLETSSKSFHDALDVQLATYVGYLIGKYDDKNTNYYVVSQDKGFSFICKFWDNRGYKMKQIDCVYDGDVNIAKERIRSDVADVVKDKKIAASVSKIIIELKTKSGIYNSLVKKYGEETGLNYYNKIKPLIKDKK